MIVPIIKKHATPFYFINQVTFAFILLISHFGDGVPTEAHDGPLLAD